MIRAIGIHYGTGRHAITVTDPKTYAIVRPLQPTTQKLLHRLTEPRRSIQSVITGEVMNCIGFVFTKSSVLLFYHRLFPGRTFRNILIGVGIIVLSWGISGTCVAIFECVPITTMWELGVDGRCIDIGLAALILTCVNVVTDVVLLCLPLQRIWQLQMSRVQKGQIGGMFALGAL